MPAFFWMSLLIGYLVGVGGAVLINPIDALAPLTPYLMMSCLAAIVALVWLIVQPMLGAERFGSALAEGATEAGPNQLEPGAAEYFAAASKKPAVPFSARPERAILNAGPILNTGQGESIDLLAGHRVKPGELAALISILESLPKTLPNDAAALASSGYRLRHAGLRGGFLHADYAVDDEPPSRNEESVQPRRRIGGLAQPLTTSETAWGLERLEADRFSSSPPATADNARSAAERTRSASSPLAAGESGPNSVHPRGEDSGLLLDDVLSPAIAIQPIRTLPQRKLTMIDLDIKGGSKARDFWSNEDEAELARLDRTILQTAMQTVTDLLPGHPARTVSVNLSSSSLDDAAVRAALTELASLSAGSHLRVIAVLAHKPDAEIDLASVKGRVPMPLETGLLIDHAKDWLPDILVEHDVLTVKLPASRALSTDAVLELDRSLCLRIDGYAARGVDLILTGIDRKQTLLNILDYPVKFGQGAELGSQTIRLDGAAHGRA